MLKLTAVFFLALLPVALLYYNVFHLSRTLLTEEVTASIQRQKQNFSSQFNDDLQRIRLTNAMLSRNWEIIRLAVIPEVLASNVRYDAISNTRHQITLIQTTSHLLESIDVYIPALDISISTNQSRQALENMRLLTDEIDQIPYDRFLIRNDEIVLIAKYTLSPGAPPVLLIQTTLSLSHIHNMLQQSSPNDITHVILFCLSDQALFPIQESVNGPDHEIAHFVAQYLNNLHSPPSTGAIDISVNQTTYKVFYIRLLPGDLVLIQYFNPNDIQVEFQYMQQLMTIFVIIFALAVLILFLSLYKLINRTYQQTIYLQKAELKLLQAQIAPHFLYNSFFILNKRIRAGDSHGALTFSNALSGYFQYVTHDAEENMPLYKEVEHTYNYTNIQQVRFSNRLSLNLSDIPSGWADVQVPRLILQPVIENVFRHVIDKERSHLELMVRYEPREDFLCIHVEDSGGKLSDETIRALAQKFGDQSKGQEVSGLINIHKRLRLCYGDGYGITVNRSHLGGLHVTLKIKAEVIQYDI